jgi:DNA repair photolyase
MSIAIYDDELQKSIEPGTPSATARLATVTAVREAGLDCSVFMMPILPYLTDSKAHLDYALKRIADAGGSAVLFTALHLKPGVRPWFMHWLQREHPELVDTYNKLYGRNAFAPKEYRKWLAARIRPLIRAHGLERGREDPATGGVASSAVRESALGMLRTDEGERAPVAPTLPGLEPPSTRRVRMLPATEEPMLF